MNAGRLSWLGPATLVGAIYLVVNLGSGELAAAATSHRMVLVWRWLAFIASGVAFLVHIAYEHFRLRGEARTTAWHTSVAVALGGFGLALAANIHDLGTTSGYRPRMAVALVAWPLLTAGPAFLAAFLIAAGLDARRVHEG
jgi:hypothetical protein